jgi:hypothetical protein
MHILYSTAGRGAVVDSDRTICKNYISSSHLSGETTLNSPARAVLFASFSKALSFVISVCAFASRASSRNF